MNSWQIAQEIRDRLRTAVWPLEGREPVFGPEGAYVVAGAPTEDGLPGSWPFALVFVGDGSADDDEPDLESVPISVAVGVYVEGDVLGEQAVIGGPRAGARLGTSEGRGILEVSALVKSVIGDLSGFLGVPIIFKAASTPSVQTIEQGAHLVVQVVAFDATCTGQPEIMGPYNVVVSGSTVSWELSAAVVGFVEYVIVGSAAPISKPSDGTIIGVTLAPPFTSPGVSAHTYVTIFAGYSWVEGGTSQVYSGALVGTYRGP